MEGRTDGGLPEPSPGPRASDDDRLVVITRLREAAGEGLIDLDELEDRIAATYAARTLPDLVPLTADLPEPHERPSPTKPPPASGSDLSSPLRAIFGSAMDSASFRSHLTVYLCVIGMLVGIWVINGFGHPWPFYPAAGWGIGLASHWQAAASGREKEREDELRRRQQERRERRNERHERHARKHERRLDRGQPGLPTPPAPPTPATEPSPAAAPSPRSSPAAQPSDNGHRRFVVAMFVDVVNSTQLNEALGDEQWSALRRSVHTMVRNCVTEAGGWEANTSGDGILARFDQPSSAATAATQILRRLERQRSESGFAPSVRVGIHSGDAVDEDGDIIGNVVNLAARVTGAAAPDEILVTEHVADHLGANHATEGRGLHTLKGVGRPRHLLAVRW